MLSYTKYYLVIIASMVILISSAFSKNDEKRETLRMIQNPTCQRFQGRTFSQKSIELSGIPDPRTDLKLHPAKGHTLWFEENRTTSIWLPKRLRKVDVKIDGGIEITFSPLVYPRDGLAVAHGLEQYNRNKVGAGKIAESTDTWGGILKVASQPIGEVIGLNVNGSLIIDLEALQSALHCSAFEASHFFPEIIHSVNSRKDKRIHQILTESYDDRCFSVLRSSGFKTLDISPVSLTTGKRPQAFYYDSFSSQVLQSRVSCSLIQWIASSDTPSDASSFKDTFGIFIRTPGGVKGGLLGTLHKDAKIPHAYIEKFWVDESIRGTGLGRKLIIFAEDYIKNQDLHRVRLGTCTFQAPDFYRKIGFKEVFRLPRFFQLSDGTWADAFTFEKTI